MTRDEVRQAVLDVLARAAGAGGEGEGAGGEGTGAGAAGFCTEDDIFGELAGRGGTRGQIKYALHRAERQGLVEAVRGVEVATRYRLRGK